MLERDPANPDGPRRSPRGMDERVARRARERIASAYSTYVEAEASRSHAFVRRLRLPRAYWRMGDRLVIAEEGALVLEDIESGERTRVANPLLTTDCALGPGACTHSENT